MTFISSVRAKWKLGEQKLIGANLIFTLGGSTEAKGREPKTCLGRVFNYKLGCFDDVHVFIYVDAHLHL